MWGDDATPSPLCDNHSYRFDWFRRTHVPPHRKRGKIRQNAVSIRTETGDHPDNRATETGDHPDKTRTGNAMPRPPAPARNSGMTPVKAGR
jgi:hypothetical protein